MNTRDPIYRVIFCQDGKTYELYARYVSEEAMPAFLEVEYLLFRTDQTLLDPSEEKLKAEFKGVERTYIPIHAIIRVDEVFEEGPSRIKDRPAKKGDGNVWQFPIKKSPKGDPNE